jgi:hypothetical protein
MPVLSKGDEANSGGHGGPPYNPKIKTFFLKKAATAPRPFRYADESSVSDEIDMKGKSFPLWHERAHPCMSFLCIDLLRNESKAFPHSQNMSVNGKGFPAQTKKEEAMNRLWSNPFEFPKALLDLFLAHPFQESEAHFPFPLPEPLKDIHDTLRLLSRKSPRAKGFHNHPPLSIEDIFPFGKLVFQSLVGPIPILVVGILRKNGLNEDIQQINFFLSFGNSIHPFQKGIDSLELSFRLSESRRFHKIGVL